MANKNHRVFSERLSEILKRLNNGETLEVASLAAEFDVSERTIQRDFNERLDFLTWQQKGPKKYKLDKRKFGHLITEDIERFARFCSIQDLLPQIDKQFYQQSLLQSIQVKGFQYENIKGKEHEFNLIEAACKHHHWLEFNYTKTGQNESKYYQIAPYILLNKNGIWYLIGTDNHGKQKTFCFTQMRAIRKQPETFIPDEQLLNQIRESDSISHGNQLAEIVIQINAVIAPYFLRRDVLPNQQLTSQLHDGGLILTCHNVHENEVYPSCNTGYQTHASLAQIVCKPKWKHV